MPTTSPNVTVTATDFAHAQVLFDVAAGDTPCNTYFVHNRDATNYVRVVVTPLHKGADGGAPISPGANIPFRAGSEQAGSAPITKVVVWTEGGTPAIDGFVEGNMA